MISDDSKCNQMNSDDSGCDQMKSNEINCNQLSPYSKSNTNTKSMMVSAGARAREGDTIITDEEAFSIQKDHDEIFSAMEDAGFEMSNGMMKNATDLYDKYGKEAMLGAIEKCIGCTGNKLRYLQKILENRDVPKLSGNCMSHEETAELEKNMFW